MSEPFVVKFYTGEDGPTIKGNGFDGLRVGEDREEAEEFVKWINERIAAAPTPEVDALKAAPTPPAHLTTDEYAKKWRAGEFKDRLKDRAAPTPPAPEAEPVAIVDYRSVAVWLKAIRPCEGTKLYTRPANDGLRKAAEEALGVLEDFNAPETDIARVIKNLRAELDKGKA